MKAKFFLVGCIIAFAACGASPSKNELNNGQSVSGSALLQRIQETKTRDSEQALEPTARLILKQIPSSTDGIEIAEVWLENPAELPIVSVRSFIAYDPTVLTGIKVELPQKSPFTIPAPGESEFDEENGIVKIGLSAMAGNVVSEKAIPVATVAFKRKKDAFTTLDFYGAGDGGHTLVLAKTAEETYKNVLQTPAIPALVFFDQL